MKEFQSIFKNELVEYLEISKGTISKATLQNTHRVLLSFDSLLAGENVKEISETFINQWIRGLHQANAPKTSDSYAPYIFSDEEIHTLLVSADNWAERHTGQKTRQTDMEFCMLLRMLLGCGFRLSEPLAVKVNDMNFHAWTIRIHHAKNNKQRVIPMDKTLTGMLERYF